jgi:hypothetical protein
VKRVALLPQDLHSLPSFPASGQEEGPSYRSFVDHYGDRCWELDAMAPNDLRTRIKEMIEAQILDRAAWERCSVV